jgi:hypothetical protein
MDDSREALERALLADPFDAARRARYAALLLEAGEVAPADWRAVSQYLEERRRKERAAHESEHGPH